MMPGSKPVEARVSRYYSRTGQPGLQHPQWDDLVTIYTIEWGSWTMPYDAFVALFGVCIAASTYGVMVDLPVRAQENPVR